MSNQDISSLLKKLVPPALADIQSYEPSGNFGDDYARLDAMESPFGFRNLPADLQAKWLEIIKSAEVNRYPPRLSQSSIDSLKILSSYKDIEAVKLVAGNGSDELILLLMLLCAVARGGKVLSPSPSFSMYSHITKAIGGEFIGIELEQDFSLDLDKFEQAIQEHKPQVIFIAQPNNPTGNLFPEQVISMAAELNADNGLVVVDRAYDFFCPPNSSDKDYSRYFNLVELHTLSKIGTAGLRFGFALGHPQVMDELAKLRLPYNINTLTGCSIEFLLQHLGQFRSWAGDIIDYRQELIQQMTDMADLGLEVFPSATNFILFRMQGVDATKCYDYLKDNKVLTKNFSDYHPLLKNCIRASIGTPDENSRLIKQLRDFLS